MSTAVPGLPLWAAIIVSLLVVTGAFFTLVGAIGLLRMRSFYERTHTPTIGSSFGVIMISLASALCFSVLGTRVAVAEGLILLFVTLTMPVTLILLARAALYRDELKGRSMVNRSPPPRDEAG